jgi:sugar/nucleoside kinase (ribokinase family)
MNDAGMSTIHVRTITGAPTLAALCYQFPDGSGGNISERHSASSRVKPEDIDRALPEGEGRSGIAAALPEVPIEARLHLLRRAKEAGMKTAASFITSEIQEVREKEIVKYVDILTLNIDEAAAFASIDRIDLSSPESMEPVVDGCFDYLSGINSEAACVVTAGSGGFYAFRRGRTARIPSLNVECVNSAGAGDALMAGIIIADVLGFPFMPPEENAAHSFSALELANCLAAMSVESPDTINFRVTPESFIAFCTAHGRTGVAAAL